MDTIMLRMILSTLNSVEVKGKQNMDYLLGSIQTLEKIVQEAESQEPEAPKSE